MEIWTSGVLLLWLSLQRVNSQTFQLQMQLTDYRRGNNIPSEVNFEACLRDSSTGCDIACSSEEALSATIEAEATDLNTDISNIDPLVFPPILAGDHIVCFRFRRLNRNNIVSSSTDKSINMTEGPDMRTYARSGSLQNLIGLSYELQVLCSENYFSPTCSIRCTPTGTPSGDFLCSGEDGVEIICQPDQNEGPDLANCQENVATTATEDRGGEMTTSNEETSSTTSSNVNAVGSLSQGEVAGIVIPILLITALVAAGAVAGILVWKHQPWHNVLSKEGTNDALENPVYNEMVLGVGHPGQNNELSASTFSSPLYSDTSADAGEDTAGRREYVENGNLMDIIRMQSAKKKNFKVQHSKEGINGTVAPQKTNTTEDSYRQSFTFGDNRPDDQETYEPVEVSPTPTFDNPDYEAV